MRGIRLPIKCFQDMRTWIFKITNNIVVADADGCLIHAEEIMVHSIKSYEADGRGGWENPEISLIFSKD